MSYEQWRMTAVRNVYSQTVSNLLSNYDPTSPTIVLLPGGMGSQLDQSLDTYRNAGAPPPSDYDTVWIDDGIFEYKDGLKLEIDKRGRDKGGHVIVPNGALRYHMDDNFEITPYEETEKYFSDLGWNFVTFGFDWRRSLIENASNLNSFLTLFYEETRRKHNIDPLPTTSLLAHSQGGLVAKVFLDMSTYATTWINKIITVATPFYGTWSHQERYFVGHELLNSLYGKTTVAAIVSTLPGPYILMYLDKETYLRDGKNIGLHAYPIIDADTGDDADPYDLSNHSRYPSWVNSAYIKKARSHRRIVTKELAEPVRNKVFTVRSCLDQQTPSTLSWQIIGEDFDPENNESPIGVKSTVGGDGTVPGWSAWLPGLPNGNRVDLKRAKDHMLLMEHDEVLEVARSIVIDGTVPSNIPKPIESYRESAPVASRNEIVDFLSDIRECRADRTDQRNRDPLMWRGIMRSFIK